MCRGACRMGCPSTTDIIATTRDGAPRRTLFGRLAGLRRRHRLILRINARRDPTPERGIRPVDRPVHQPMFHGVVVNVVDMTQKIVLIDNTMLPETSLPDAALPSLKMASSDKRKMRNLSREQRLQSRPAPSIVGIAFRQGPDAVQMIGHDRDRHDIERSCRPGIAECSPQSVDVRGQATIATIGEVDREEAGAPRHP